MVICQSFLLVAAFSDALVVPPPGLQGVYFGNSMQEQKKTNRSED